ncbi:MAG TPA: AarF/UbiB family protein [Polyangiaceae bacterium]
MIYIIVSMACAFWGIVIAFQESVMWGLLSMFVPCAHLVFVAKFWDRAKKPFLIQIGAVSLLVVVVLLSLDSEARAKRAAPVARAEETPSALPTVTKAPPPPQVTGSPVDLSTVMGRARALADGWQPEAVLCGIDATIRQGLIQTGEGAKATLVFGPSSFRTPRERTGSFIVTYDADGMHGAPSTAVAGKALIEPMCAPETAYARVTGSSGAPVRLRYALDSRGKPRFGCSRARVTPPGRRPPSTANGAHRWRASPSSGCPSARLRGDRNWTSVRSVSPARATRAERSDARRLRELREVLGLSQRELAKEFKVAHGAIASWESGARALPGPVSKLLDLYEAELGLSAASAGLETSFAARNYALSKLAGNVLLRTLGGVLARWLAEDSQASAVSAHTHAAVARNLVEALGELKGLAMKVGQTLGYLDFMLSDAARAELSTLMTSARPLRASLVAQVFLEDQQRLPSELFAEWSPQPFAVASLGQVHRARLANGREVAVKVQYPGIARTLEADLSNAQWLDRLASLIFRGQERGVIMAELRERLTEECDYRLEAQQQQEFRLRWSNTPGLRIPEVHLSACSQRVLVSDLSAGEGLSSFLERATTAERDHAGLLLFRFFVESFCRHGVFNADPHPGNFLFFEAEVILLDFGCVKRMKPEQVSWWRSFLRAYLERKFEQARELLIQMDMIPDPAHYDFEAHYRMVLTTYEFSLSEAPFRFTPAFMHRLIAVRGRDNPGKFRVNLPKDWLFANRMVLGLFALLSRLEAKADFRGALLDALYEPGEPRPAPYSETELRLLVRK